VGEICVCYGKEYEDGYILGLIKSSRAISRVKWFKHEETNVSRSISVLVQNPEDEDEDEDGAGPRNVGLFMFKPLDAADSPRRFYYTHSL
jgi:hypothetical protein